MGREIVVAEQQGAERAGYGEQLAKRLSKRLIAQFGRGFSFSNVKRMRQFYLAFPLGSALPGAGSEKGSALRSLFEAIFPPNLSWTHYRLLITVEREAARRFYEIEAIRESWSTRELERQIGSLLFESAPARTRSRCWRG